MSTRYPWRCNHSYTTRSREERSVMNLTTKTKIVIGIAAGVLALGGGTALALSGASNVQVTGPAADQARAAAASAVPGGRAGEVRAETNGGAAYGVNGTRPDGST